MTLIDTSLRSLRRNNSGDFLPVIVLGASPNLFGVPEQSQFKTMKEFFAFGQANPGQLNWASPGAGTTQQLAEEILKARAEIEMAHIPSPALAPDRQGGLKIKSALRLVSPELFGFVLPIARFDELFSRRFTHRQLIFESLRFGFVLPNQV